MLIAFVVFVLLLLILEWLTLQEPLKGLSYTCTTDQKVVEVAMPFWLETRLDNHRNLPIPFVRLQENLPTGLVLEGRRPLVIEDAGQSLSGSAYLMPRQRLIRRIRAHFTARGRYVFRGATLFRGDLFGLRETGQSHHQLHEVVVLPPYSQDKLALDKLGSYLGDRSVVRFIMEDPMLVASFREYTGQEAQKAISWPQSLRMNQLMVKKMDHTQTLSATLLLNVQTPPGLSDRGQRLEACFSLARSVASALQDQEMGFAFITNATSAGGRHLSLRLEQGQGKSHLARLAEGLGRATYDCQFSLKSLLTQSRLRARQNQIQILITPEVPPEGLAELKALEKKTGHPICILVPQAVKVGEAS